MSNTDIFLNEYKGLEDWAREMGYEDLKEIETTSYNKKEIDYFRHVRNTLTHNATVDKDNKEYITLNENFITRFRTLMDCLTSPQSVMEYAVRRSDIYCRQIGDMVMPAVKRMKEREYTHIPIMCNNCIWGVFSENTLFDLYSNDEELSQGLSFLKIAKYITVKGNSSVYSFIGKDKSIADVRMIFNKAIDENRRLDVLFITDTGSSSDPLRGMITIWDVAGINN